MRMPTDEKINQARMPDVRIGDAKSEWRLPMTRWQQIGATLCGSIGVMLVVICSVLLYANVGWAQGTLPSGPCVGAVCDLTCVSSPAGFCFGSCNATTGCTRCVCTDTDLDPNITDCECL
jgi:hypothetical protein